VSAEYRRALEHNVAMQRRVGVDTTVFSVEDVKKIAPVVSVRGDEAVAYERESGYADPYSVTTGYARRAREMSADVRLDTPATEIEVAGGKVAAVATPEGRIATPVAVIAAGPWSGPLLAGLGIEAPLDTVRHQVVMLRRPEDQVPDHPTVGDVVNSLSARPDAGNMTLVGVGEEESVGPGEYNQGVDMPVVERVFRDLVSRMPGMANALFRGGWSGLFTTTPDWHPTLDRVEGIDGLYCAVGFSGHGFKLAPVVGRVMAELITQGRATSLDISALGLGRFREGNFLGSRYRMGVLA
jgi:sarcosine oxidase subunit beta